MSEELKSVIAMSAEIQTSRFRVRLLEFLQPRR